MIWHSVSGAKDNSLLSCNGSSLEKGEGTENFSEFKVESLVEIFSLAPSRVPMQLSLHHSSHECVQGPSIILSALLKLRGEPPIGQTNANWKPNGSKGTL